MAARKLPTVAALVFGILPGSALASGDITGPSAAMMGGATVAARADNSSIASNPATVALAERYDLAGHVGFGPSGAFEASASIVDSKESRLALGVVYRRLVADPPLSSADLPGWTVKGETPSNVHRYHDVDFALAYPFLDRKLSVGLGGAISITHHDRRDPRTIANADAGFAYAPTKGLTLGLAARNLLPTKDPSGDQPLDAAFGVRYDAESLGSIALDARWQLEGDPASPLSLRFGVDKIIGSDQDTHGDFGLGVRYDGPLERQAITWGFAVGNAEGSFDYAMEVPFGEPFRVGGLVHRIGLRVKT